MNALKKRLDRLEARIGRVEDMSFQSFMGKYLDLIDGSSRCLPRDDFKPDPKRDAAIDELLRAYPHHAATLKKNNDEIYRETMESINASLEGCPRDPIYDEKFNRLSLGEMFDVIVDKRDLDDVLKEKQGRNDFWAWEDESRNWNEHYGLPRQGLFFIQPQRSREAGRTPLVDHPYAPAPIVYIAESILKPKTAGLSI